MLIDLEWVKRVITGIVGAGSYVPEQIMINDDLAGVMETDGEQIRDRTGIGARRIATNKDTSYMVAEASVDALEDVGIKPDEIDPILLTTSSPDYCSPSGACKIQDKIDAVSATCFDISATCTGFAHAPNTAHTFISSGIYKAALVIGTDVLSKLTDWTGRGTCVLFGGDAGAIVIKADEAGILGMNMHSNGTKGGVLTCGSRTNGNFLLDKGPEPRYVTTDGQEVFKFAVRKIPQCIIEVLEDIEMKAEDARYSATRQADHRIIESMAKRLKVNMDHFPANMEHYGNTSGVSAPVLLDELSRKGMLSAGDKVMLSGFGAGLTWGTTPLGW